MKSNTSKEDTLPGKKGICLVLKGPKTERNLERLSQLDVYWNYSWSPTCISNQPRSSLFVPQIWGGAKNDEAFREKIQTIKALIQAGRGGPLVLGMNECDKSEQSNIPVERAIHYWKLILEELDDRDNFVLCSPSCANPLGCVKPDDSNQNVRGRWMRDFMEQIQANKLRCDLVGVHWYGGPCLKAFQTRMRNIYEAYGLSLVLTEFAVADWKASEVGSNRYSRQQVLEFMKQALPWLEETPWIIGYSWFSFDAESPVGTCSALFTKQENLTALGRYYRSVSSENHEGNQEEKVWCCPGLVAS